MSTRLVIREEVRWGLCPDEQGLTSNDACRRSRRTLKRDRRAPAQETVGTVARNGTYRSPTRYLSTRSRPSRGWRSADVVLRFAYG